MALVEYGCASCGVRKEKLFRKNDSPPTITCPVCGSEAERLLSDFGFRFENGEVPGNSGVYSLDTDHDKAIGRDAESRWEYIKDRNSRKRQVQRDTAGKEDVGKVPLRLNEEGEYVPMEDTEINRFQKLHGEFDSIREDYQKWEEAKTASPDKEDADA